MASTKTKNAEKGKLNMRLVFTMWLGSIDYIRIQIACYHRDAHTHTRTYHWL